MSLAHPLGATPVPGSDRSSSLLGRVAAAARLLGRQVGYEQLAFWRNRVGALFTVGFSLVFLVLLGASAGNGRSAVLGHLRLIQYYVPGFAAYGVMAACFTNLSVHIVYRRETGLLKRLRLSPMPTWVFLGALAASTAIVALVEAVVVIFIGWAAYGLHLPAHPLPVVVALLVGIASFTALGMATSTFVPNEDAAAPVTNIVFFVFLFLSGLWFPLTPHSTLARLSSWFPFRHFLLAVFTPFDIGHGVSPWAWGDLGVVALWGAASVVVAARRMEWAPRRR